MEQTSLTEGSRPSEFLARQKEGLKWDWNDYIAYFLRQKSQLFPVIIIKLLANFWGWPYFFLAYGSIRY